MVLVDPAVYDGHNDAGCVLEASGRAVRDQGELRRGPRGVTKADRFAFVPHVCKQLFCTGGTNAYSTSFMRAT